MEPRRFDPQRGLLVATQATKPTSRPGAPPPVCPVMATPTSPTPSQRRRRYPSDTTDTEWALLEPLLPAPACTHVAGGRPEAHPRREVVDAIRYLVHNGCVWRALPADFPPWRTVYGFFARWVVDGTLDRIHDAVRDQVRGDAGRRRQPSAAIIDSQSVRAADTVPPVPQLQPSHEQHEQEPAPVGGRARWRGWPSQRSCVRRDGCAGPMPRSRARRLRRPGSGQRPRDHRRRSAWPATGSSIRLG